MSNKKQSAGHTVRCQVCDGNQLFEVLDLGYQPLCNDFQPGNEPARAQTFYPLCLYYCADCTLTQIGYVIPTKETFGDQYTYLTGSSRSLIDYYSRLAQRLVDKFGMAPGETVVEIGSNDGTFLEAFRSLGMKVVGVDGAKQATNLAINDSIPTIEQFYGKGTNALIRERVPQGEKIRLVVAMNVLAHTDNINEFLSEVVDLMDTDTVLVSSSHWLLELIRKFEFDTIYHEHLRYYTLGSLIHLFRRHGLSVNDAEVTDFYGGSIVAFAQKQPSPPSKEMLEVLHQEKQIQVPEALMSMKKTLLQNKANLLQLLVELKMSGKRVIGVGAPMKASTLLNFYGITADLIEYAAEVNPLKVGTVVPGVRVPVSHEDLVFQDPPDYALLLSWNMSDFIIPNYRSMGYKGKFILPVPEPTVIE